MQNKLSKTLGVPIRPMGDIIISQFPPVEWGNDVSYRILKLNFTLNAIRTNNLQTTLNILKMKNELSLVLKVAFLMTRLSNQYLSRVMRKLAFCISENKGADQLHGNHAADQRLCFRNIEGTIPLLPKSQFKPLNIFCGCTPGLCRAGCN